MFSLFLLYFSQNIFSSILFNTLDLTKNVVLKLHNHLLLYIHLILLFSSKYIVIKFMLLIFVV